MSAVTGVPRPRVDGRRLRDTMGRFATGVALVTVEHAGCGHGMTVNSLTSVSLDPPLILVCLARHSRTAAAIGARGAFVVNILDDSQDALSNRFARPGGDDRFAGIDVRTNAHGLPEVPALAHLTCLVRAIHDGGDHDIVVADVLDTHIRELRPLIFHRGRYDTLTGDARDAEWYW
jgi:flavin reductase (DIM6/NTAB) family NADH-FMN oxidoreductase RutF